MSAWTEDKVEKLKELWGTGLTAAQIAETLGGVSRNAVIGKANRLGLSKPGRPRAQKAAAPATPAEAKPVKAAPAAPAPRTVAEKPASRKPIQRPAEPAVEHISPPPRAAKGKIPSHRRCQWPIGHPGDDDFHFCEHESLATKPYCEFHCRMAYRQKVEAA